MLGGFRESSVDLRNGDLNLNIATGLSVWAWGISQLFRKVYGCRRIQVLGCKGFFDLGVQGSVFSRFRD